MDRSEGAAPDPAVTLSRSAKVEVKWKKDWHRATVLKVKVGVHYIHYDDSDDWDEWVSSKRIRKILK